MVGDEIVEVAPDGTVTHVFSVWDYLAPTDERSDLWNADFYPQGYDWTHGNALVYDEVHPLTGGEAYTFSFGGLDLFLVVDRASGEVLYEFSGLGGYGTEDAWTVAEGSTPFSFQHDTNWSAGDGNVLMVTTNNYDDGQWTLGIEYELDEATRTLREVWSYGLGEGLQAFALGQCRRLANGNTWISWGSGGIVREVTPAGEVVWEMAAPAGTFFGQIHYISDLYTGE